MSLFLPIAQITARSAPESNARPEGTALAVGVPFRLELTLALGQEAATTEGTAAASQALPEAGAATERLDPMGAALRALLGSENPAAETAELPLESPNLEEPTTAEGPAATAEGLAAALATVPLPFLSTPAEPLTADPAQTGASPVLERLSALTPQVAPTGSPDSAMEAPPIPVEPIELELAVPGAQIKEESEEPTLGRVAAHPTEDQSPGEATKGIADLLDLVADAEAREAVRPTEASAESGLAPEEPADQSLVQTVPESATDLEVQPEDLAAQGIDRAKAHVGELMPAATEESRPTRSTEIPAPALLNQVSRSIRLLTEGARSELHIKLHPAELGEVLVRLTVQDGLVTAQLQTSDAAVKATLDANLDALRARFEQQGLQVNSLAVSTGAGQLTDDGQAKSGWSQPTDHPTRNAAHTDDEGEEPEGAPQATPGRRILGRRWGSRLDHLA